MPSLHRAPPKAPYLPAGRTPPEALAADVERLAEHPLVTGLLRAQRAAVAILNARRQVVASNVRFLDLAGVEDPAAILGLRFGESLDCVGVEEGEDGCGTAPRCAGCGVAQATLGASRDRTCERDCALRSERDGVREDLGLRVTAIPFQVAARPYTALLVSDAAREAAGPRDTAVRGARFAGRMVGACDAYRRTQAPGDFERVDRLARLIRGELAVRALLGGEPGAEEELPPLGPVEAEAALRRVVADLGDHPAAQGRTVVVEPVPKGAVVRGEAAAVNHVLLAMAVNALEATRAGGAVRLAVREAPHHLALGVWNAGEIPAVAAPRIFQRWFSTKGPGRGQGTWAMRQVARQVLGGRVAFFSSRDEGTWFALMLRRG